jgi:hypothetical protein
MSVTKIRSIKVSLLPEKCIGLAIKLVSPLTVMISNTQAGTIPIDRSISDHDGTYATIHSGYDHKQSFIIDVWNYKRANYDLMK